MVTSINFITGNANKLREVRAILEPEVTVQNYSIDVEEIQGTPEEVARFKCRKAAEIINAPVLVEDTSLCFNALNGLPGPYIKWFMHSIGYAGLNNLLAAYEDKSAEAITTYAFCAGPGKDVHLFQGRCSGKIVPPRGPPIFGWDPIFEYDGQTFAEMDESAKNKISPRGQGLQKLQAWFKEQTSMTQSLLKSD